MSDEYTLPVNDDIYITGEIEEVAPDFSEIDDDDSTQETVTRTPANISSDNRSSIGSGELNPSPSDVVPADVTTSEVIVTQRVRHQIDDYEPAALKALSDAGAVFYGVYADGHEEGPIPWTDVYDLDPEGTIIELDEEIASAIAQNFWADTQGVHITDDPYDEWIEGYEANPQFPNLSTTKNYYNILLNAGGALLRRALNNLVSINRTAISFYDGLGNASTNIMAFFGRNGAQIGRSDEKHVVINSSGIGSYNGDGTVADFTMRGSSIVNSTISGSALVDNTITGGKIANATITGSNIDSGTITNANIANGTITGAKIDSGTITNANIADGTIQGSKIQGSTLTDIPFAAITDAEVEVASIADAQIATATITEAQVENLSTDYAHLTQGVIDNAKIDHADVNGLSANYATIANLNAATARIGDLEADHVSVSDFEAEQGYIDDLQAATADIATIRADSAKVHSLTAAQLSAAAAYIAALNADNITAASLSADVGKIHNLTANELSAAAAYIAALNADSVTAQNIIAMNGDFATVKANAAKVANLTAAQLEADHATVGSLDANYAQINMANVNNAWITNGAIKNGAISDAMINSVSANKLTAGTIDASNITVTNLNADNITTGTINGQRIGEGSLSLSKLEDDVYTEAEVDAKLSTMQSQIDGAIETWTGTDVPTLQNSPASSWNTTALKDSHVGDVYFVVNSNSQQNGYNYRFTKSGSTYSWQLIKDSDVTNALQRLTTAEGQITTFDSDISQLKTDTGTLTTKTTSLETRMSDAEADILDKVDTTTFNEVSDTVDSHSQSITQMTTTLSNKADSSTVSAVTQRVSKNEQDISGINTTIGTLTTTVESKADGSTVETMSTKLNTVETTVNGHTQSISSINSTLATKADSSTVSTLTTKVNNVSDTVDGHTSQLSSITQTQTSIQQNAVKSTVQLWFTKADTTAPAKPTAHVTTNNAATGNAWNLAVPTYNSTYPNYYYCYEYQYVDGSYGWSAVTRDVATGEMQERARTAIANAANAQADIDGLEIGGRNLLLWSTPSAENLSKISTASANNSFVTEDGYSCYKITGGGTSGSQYKPAGKIWPDLMANTTYTYSAWVKVTTTETSVTGVPFDFSHLGHFTVYNSNSANTNDKSHEDVVGSRIYSPSSVAVDKWTYIALTFTTNSLDGSGFGVYPKYNLNSTYTVYIRSQKLEKGTKATDWTPAPEDVDADISTAQTSADNAQATADKNVKESQQLWFTKANGSAPNKPTSKVTSTSTSGNAWTTKIPTYSSSYPYYFYCMQYIAADGTVTWSDVVYDQATTEAQSVARTTSANLTTLQQDYATFKQTTQNFESTIGTTYATKTELQTTDDKINNLEIGGRNLLLDTADFGTAWYSTKSKETTVFEENGIFYAKLWHSDSSSWTQYVRQTVTFELDIPYTLSLLVRKTNTDGVDPRLAIRNDRGAAITFFTPNTGCVISNTEWKRYAFTINKVHASSASEPLTIYALFTENNGALGPESAIQIAQVKLEKGNRATDWTPAPEDVDAAIEAVPRMAKINMSSRNFTSSQWNTFGAVGHVENWTTGATYDNSHLRVGDRAYLVGTISDKNAGSATIIGEVTKVQPEGAGTSYVTLKSEQLIFGGDVVTAIESRVSTAETSITQTNSQIALKANASDVYTKTQVDGKITQEISDRNSAIEQSANAINLSVSQTYTTKTEFDALEVGGRNLLLFSQLLSKDGTTAYGYSSNANTYGFDGTYKGCAVWSATKTQTSSYSEMLTTDAAKVSAWVIGPNESYVLSFWAKASAETSITSYFYLGGNNTCDLVETSTGYSGTAVDGSATLTIGTGWERYWVRWHFNNNTDPSLRKNLIIARAQASTTGTVWIAGPKLEKGTRATDWSPAPEDMVTTTAFESARSEIQQTTDGITSTVEKVSSAKYLTSAISGWPLSNIKAYGSHDTQTTFTVASTDGVRVGDTVYIKGTDTTRNCTVYIKGVVKTISSATSVTVYGRGYEDILPVESIKSTINQSSDSVKIQAKHVEIDGAAIFSNSAFKQAADAAYDAKGSAASLIAGGDNLIGGFNNDQVVGATYNYRTGTLTSTTTTNTTNSSAYLTGYNGSTPAVDIGSGFNKVGNVGHWTFEKASTFNRIRLKFNGNKADAAVYWDISSIPNGTQLTLSFKLDSLSSDGQGNGGVMSGINLRKGNMPSQWSLAPEDEVVGGRNLLRNTNWNSETIKKFKTATSSTNVLGNAIGEWHRETRATLGFDASGLMTITVPNYTTRYGIYQDVSLSPGHYILSVDTGSLFKSFIDSVQWPAKNPIDGSNSRNSVEIDVAEEAVYRVYIAYNNGAVMYGNHMKLEKGTKATDWTPAPEDTDAAISAVSTVANNAAPKASAVTRTQRIYYRKSASGAPGTPGSTSSAWVSQIGNVSNAWTTMHVPISSTEKFIYTCEQRQFGDGNIAYTSVLLDNTITVIDGGNIITGTVSANAVNASSGTFDMANIPELSAAKITSGDISADRIKANVISAINSLTAGQIDAERINASQLSIGQSQVTDLTSDLADAKKHTQVIVSATNVNYAANTCTLTARLYIDGVLQTATSLKWQWYRDGTAQGSQQTAATGTLAVTSSLGLAHRYACKCTF